MRLLSGMNACIYMSEVAYNDMQGRGVCVCVCVRVFVCLRRPERKNRKKRSGFTALNYR